MNQKHVFLLKPVQNVCDQILREVERTDHFSVAHVLMNPNQKSLFHEHREMHEVYVITKGEGVLEVACRRYSVKPGVVMLIKPGQHHRLYNRGLTSLEHLVIASPPFNPDDVHVHPDQEDRYEVIDPAFIPPAEESIDGAIVNALTLPEIGMSFAFGRVINDPARHKKPHHHTRLTEWVYGVEGRGLIEMSSGIHGNYRSLEPHSWTRIEPEEPHTLVNQKPEDMIAVCICHPAFDPNDIHFDEAVTAETENARA